MNSVMVWMLARTVKTAPAIADKVASAVTSGWLDMPSPMRSANPFWGSPSDLCLVMPPLWPRRRTAEVAAERLSA